MQGLSILIVNYKSVNLIINCINSFIRTISIPHWEVIIVDNDSQDDAEIHLKGLFPEIRFVQMGYNSGFARANNQAIKQTVYDTVLLLNADTIINENAINTCYYLFTKSNFVACGVQLLNADLSNQVSGSYVIKGGLNYLLLLPCSGAIIGFVAKLTSQEKPSVDNVLAVQQIDWINGAFLMVKKNVLDYAGLFDEDFFLYMEEIEWCSRLRKNGKLCLYGDVKVIHLQGETTKKHFKSEKKGYNNLFDRKGQQLMLSIWVRQRKEFGLTWFILMLMMYSIEIPLFFIYVCLSTIFFNSRFTYKEFLGYTKNYCKNLKFLKTIFFNKPNFYKVL